MNVREEDAWFDLPNQISRECAHIQSFGEVLDEIRQARHLTQEDLAKTIARSPAEVSRLINNTLPRYFTFTEVEQIALRLACSPQEIVHLVNAFTCHIMGCHGLINPDAF